MIGRGGGGIKTVVRFEHESEGFGVTRLVMVRVESKGNDGLVRETRNRCSQCSQIDARMSSVVVFGAEVRYGVGKMSSCENGRQFSPLMFRVPSQGPGTTGNGAD